MKIGILTHPLHTNYGGLLQAFALQTTLSEMGHDVEILHREYPIFKPLPLYKKLYRLVCNTVKLVTGKPQVGRYGVKALENATGTFRSKYLNINQDLYSTEDMKKYTEKGHYDAYLVGSDQVWRPMYSACITNYFLDFAEAQKAKKLSYAASFGVDEWEFNEEETKKCSRLAKLFDAVSVRESSGVELCQKHLGIEAKHVLDPTLLLDAQDYQKVIGDTKLNKDFKGLFCYVLDTNGLKREVIDYVSSQTGLQPVVVTTDANQKTFLSVEQWLKSFADAKIIVTDSFHGTVFSIIFNKPFWVIGNKERGLARFTSLLSMFGLEDRIVTSIVDVKLDKDIDWTSVNVKRAAFRKDSLNFLINVLQ